MSTPRKSHDQASGIRPVTGTAIAIGQIHGEKTTEEAQVMWRWRGSTNDRIFAMVTAPRAKGHRIIECGPDTTVDELIRRARQAAKTLPHD